MGRKIYGQLQYPEWNNSGICILYRTIKNPHKCFTVSAKEETRISGNWFHLGASALTWFLYGSLRMCPLPINGHAEPLGSAYRPGAKAPHQRHRGCWGRGRVAKASEDGERRLGKLHLLISGEQQQFLTPQCSKNYAFLIM